LQTFVLWIYFHVYGLASLAARLKALFFLFNYMTFDFSWSSLLLCDDAYFVFFDYIWINLYTLHRKRLFNFFLKCLVTIVSELRVTIICTSIVIIRLLYEKHVITRCYFPSELVLNFRLLLSFAFPVLSFLLFFLFLLLGRLFVLFIGFFLFDLLLTLTLVWKVTARDRWAAHWVVIFLLFLLLLRILFVSVCFCHNLLILII
jgi:hypothetical protein